VKKEIVFFHLKRSGSHAIINWLKKQQKEETIFVNSVGKFIDGIGNSTKNLYELNLNLNGKNFIYNFEGQHAARIKNIKKIPYLTNLSYHESKLGKSEKKYNILILRDPYNCLSSRISKVKKSPMNYIIKPPLIRKNHYPYGFRWFKKFWINQAKEFVGETNYLGRYKKIPISYNEWFTNKDYRKEIAEKTDTKFTDKGINDVKNYGGGSSFNGTKNNGRAQKMKVLERWKKNKNHPFMEDDEIRKYSERIFGDVI